MGAIEVINIIWCNIINFRKEHRAGDRLTCAAASPLSEFKQWVASQRSTRGSSDSSRSTLVAMWQSKECQLGFLGDTQQRFQKACSVNARKRQLNKMCKRYVCMLRALRLCQRQRSKPLTHDGNTGASWFPVSNLTGQPLA